jgi:hypothetical protein
MAPIPKPKTKNFRVDNRWTPELVENGFTPVSIFFLDHYHSLSPPITHAEAVLVIHIIRYKWSDDAPYPGYKTVATQMGISPQMARHHARSLSEKGYLHREMQTGATNKFHLKPLFDALIRFRKRTAAQAALKQPQANAAQPSLVAKTPPPPPPPPPPARRPISREAAKANTFAKKILARQK